MLSNHKAENPKRITDWRQSKFKIFEPTVKPKNKRLEGGGRKPLELQLENGLVEWIYDSRSNGLRVSRKLFMAKVKYFYKSEWDESEKCLFVANNLRVNHLMRRNGFLLRRKATTAQQDPKRLIDKLFLSIFRLLAGFQLNINTLL